MTDEAEVSTPAADAMDNGLEMFLNLAAPQAGYGQVIEAGGALQPVDGLTATFSRALTEHVLRHHELFSSVGGIDLGNIRPLIPLNVDPPAALEVPQDPRPAVRAQADGRARGRHHRARQSLHR